jgi:6-phosphogluconolactonase (cycloisomerase 2 family)
MEIKQRMSTRFAWLLGVVVVVSIGLLVACGSNYSSSSDGLVVVGSQGSALLQTFSFDLGNGTVSSVYNSVNDTANATCVLPGLPSSIVLDPAGAYAYAIINSSDLCEGSQTGIMAFKVNSDGTMTAVGSPVTLSTENVQVCQNGTLGQPMSFPVVPVALTMDSRGNFLFIADSFTNDSLGNAVEGAVSVLSIGGSASLTEVTGSPFTLPPSCLAAVDPVALAVTPTVLPSLGLYGQQNAVCSSVGNNPPTSEYLYMVDQSNNYAVWEFAIDSSTGALGNPPNHTAIPSFPAGAVPAGVAVDPCDRFVYVSSNQNNQVNAYSICNGLSTQSSTCPAPPLVPDDSLVKVNGSPFSLSGGATFPGPLLVDPYGNTLYVLDTGSNMISVLHISPVSGSLTTGNPAIVATGIKPMSMAIRSDDSWLFVTNFTAGTVSQYSVTPETGGLTPQPAIFVDNYPWGVAVK